MTIEQLKSALADFDTEAPASVTPYKAAKLVNTMLGTDLPPQMFYNYVKKGFITATHGPDGWQIAAADLRTWIERYAFRNIVTL